jgi:ribosomal protein S18 acetylase RimI-like enzyme
MINIEDLSVEEWENIEKERANKIGSLFCESVSDNPILRELRFNYNFLHLEPNLIGLENNKLELKVDDKRKHIHIAFIGVGEKDRKKGIGSKMMNILTNLADKYQYSIDLDVDPQFGVKKNVLIHFYSKFGFINPPNTSKNRLARKPL